ncbi:MAG: ThuA domain-containing protein [Clostridia bacterium]|jgi:type 1 glutamine amidotransferase|nr:ThuA domain-containing protein [Clostridia bacterium]
MKRKALLVQGGWIGHEPVDVAGVFNRILVEEDFETEVSDTLDSFSDPEKLKQLHLIVPIWTMGEISEEYAVNVANAVEEGVGIAGCHGGMCDAFRNNTTWQFLTGSQWVAHPGNDGVEYTVNIKKNSSSPIIEGIEDFAVKSEQYYIHIDPCVNVLATTRFPTVDGPHAANGIVDVPVVYTKLWGRGRVFYNSLGHNASVFDIPEARKLMRNGFLWAAKRG